MDFLCKTSSTLALVIAAGLITTGGAARAADLGGDCCVDLEERVAALEATAVTHGNRKMSLKISGYLNAGVLWWGDVGGSTDVRDPAFSDRNSGINVVNTDTAQSRFMLEGVAKIRSDLSAGFSIGVRPWGDKLSAISQVSTNPNPSNVDIRDTYVFLDAKSIGKVQLGQQVSAADGAFYEDLGGSSTWIASVNPGGWNTSFHLRDQSGGLTNVTWGGVLQEMSDSQTPRVAFYSRDIGGFQAAASAGSNTWALALYYSQKHGSLAVSAGIGYDVSTGAEALTTQLVGNNLIDQGNTKLAKLGLSGSLYESNSGLYGTAGYSKTSAALSGRNDATNLYGKLGWRKNVNGMGETNFYGEYDRTAEAYANDVNANMWGAGVTQDIDAAASVLYLGYRHTNLETSIDGANLIATAHQTTCGCTADAAGRIPSQGFGAVLGGMVVQF